MMKQLANRLISLCIILFLETCIGTTELELVEWDERGVLDYKCSVLLNSFAKSASNFTYCAVKRARPFKFCCMCSAEYSSLMKIKNDIYRNKKCAIELVRSEKHQIVARMYQFAKTLWYTSHCQGCFGQKWKIADFVQTFFHELGELKVCFRNNSRVPTRNSTTNGSVICRNCRSYYHRVQQAYKHVINNGQDNLVNKEDAICADVAAAMNYTRHTWSEEYNCTNPQTDLMSVIALTCFFAFIPFVFYVAVKINGEAKGKRLEVSGLPKISYDTE